MQTIQSVLVAHTWPRAFNTLHSAIKAVGLEYVLEGYKPVTLFAPSDEAFNQLHQGAIYDLLKDVNLLKTLLEYHIVPLKLTRTALMQVASSPVSTGGSTSQHSRQEQEQTIELPTLSGHTLLLASFSNDLRVQRARILEPELETDNGVVHPVERVLWPPDINEASFGERSPLSFRR